MAFTPAKLVTSEKRAASSEDKKRRMHPVLERKENIAGYLFLLPWFLGMIIFMVGPFVASLYLSFTSYNLIGIPQWIGIQNYINMFHNPDWWDAVRVTFVYVFFSVPLKIFFALMVALLLKQGLGALGIFRALYYVPSLLGGSVAIALLWRKLFDSDGVVNQVFAFFGIHTSISWISTPSFALWTLIILAVWQFGSPMLIFLAGLKQIPAEYYEAAATDGAGALRRFFTITVPMITPLIFFNLVLQMVGAFQAFTPAYIVSGGTGSPLHSTLFYTLYLYEEGFGLLQMGYASAMAWFLLVIIAVFTGLAFYTSRYWVFYADEKGREE